MRRVRLTTERLVIRELAPGDAGRVAEFHRANAHFHAPWEPLRPQSFYTAQEQRRIIRRHRRAADVLHLWLLLREGSRPHAGPIVGSIGLSGITRGHFQSCFLGYKLDARYTRRGLMREALIAVISHAFGEMGLHRLEANVAPENTRSLRLVSGLGFRKEGLARRYLKIRGAWQDHVHMALCADEWDAAAHRPR